MTKRQARSIIKHARVMYHNKQRLGSAGTLEYLEAILTLYWRKEIYPLNFRSDPLTADYPSNYGKYIKPEECVYCVKGLFNVVTDKDRLGVYLYHDLCTVGGTTVLTEIETEAMQFWETLPNVFITSVAIDREQFAKNRRETYTFVLNKVRNMRKAQWEKYATVGDRLAAVFDPK